MNLFPTEYSSLSTEALLGLVKEKYAIDNNCEITFLKRGFNDTYLIKSETEKFILRVYKHSWRSKITIESELKLLNHLKENNVSVSFPIADKQNQSIQDIQAAEGIRYAVLFSYAAGEQIRKLSVEQSYLLGKETGRIHSLTQDRSFGETAQNYDIEAQFEITLNTLKSILKDHPEQYEYVVKLKSDFIKKFNSIDKNRLASGICHGDLQAENFHITNTNEFTFFDFDFFGTGYLVYDIGVFMWYDHKNKPLEIMNAFLDGYQTERNLSIDELSLICYFSTLRALFQMTLYCKISDGKRLPLWPAQQVADFIKKVKSWSATNSVSN